MANFNLGNLWLLTIPGTAVLVYILRDAPFLLAIGVFVTIWVLYHMLQKVFRRYEIENVHNRAVFITGCGRGFGNLIVLRCLERGMPVFAGCRTEESAQALREQAKILPGKLDTMIVDVTNDESVTKAAQYLENACQKYGGLHGFINNAGIAGTPIFDDLLNVNDYKKVLDVNTLGMIRVTQALKHLVKQTRGRIVNVTSAAGRVAMSSMGPYNVSKFAANAYCDVVRQELSHFGVSLHVIEPGFFRTEILDEQNIQKELDVCWNAAPDRVREEYGEKYFYDYRSKFLKMVLSVASTDLDIVIDAYLHALIGRFPQLKYQCGGDAKFAHIPLSYLCTGLRDALYRIIVKLSGIPVPQCDNVRPPSKDFNGNAHSGDVLPEDMCGFTAKSEVKLD